MSETRDPGHHPEKPARRREMSRRQFLTYTLGGTGAFLAATPLIPMIRFAVDPLLQSTGESDFVRVAPVDAITEEPKQFDFTRVQTDGWHVDEVTFTAWISKDENGQIFALSPVCKHLGCTVSWNSNPSLPNEYFCPCHGAHYTKDGQVLAVAQGPLDEYEVDIRNGYVYLGKLKPNSRV